MTFARLKHDFQLQKYGYKPRSRGDGWEGKSNPPETVVFNHTPRAGKGRKVQFNDAMWAFTKTLNSAKAFSEGKGLLDPKMGWINTGSNPERISFGGNAVQVVEESGKFARIQTLGAPAAVTWFDTPYVVHKFTVITWRGGIIKPGKGMDAYIPIYGEGDWWIEKDFIEPFPTLPMTVMPRLWGGLREHSSASTSSATLHIYPKGAPIRLTGYELRGAEVWGRVINGGFVCLYCPTYRELMPFYSKQTTTWSMQTVPPPI